MDWKDASTFADYSDAMIALAVCSKCNVLTGVFVEADCETCEERHLDLRCGLCGLRFHATPKQVTYVQEETEKEKEELRVLTPPPFPEL